VLRQAQRQQQLTKKFASVISHFLPSRFTIVFSKLATAPFKLFISITAFFDSVIGGSDEVSVNAVASLNIWEILVVHFIQ